MEVNTPLIQQLIKQVQTIAAAARDLMEADEESRKLGIPGVAKWNGFNKNGVATVKLNGRIYLVKFIGNSVPPRGAKVYVDETFVAQYKNVKPKEPPEKVQIEEKKKPGYRRRKRNTVDPVLQQPGEIPSGATWVVYPEILKPLKVKTEVGSASNPPGYQYNLFLSLGAALVIGGGLIISLMFGGIDEQLSPFQVQVEDLPDPDEHDEIPDGLSSEDFTKLVMFQGVLDSAQVATPLWLPLDGLYAGIGGIFDNSIASILLNDHGGQGVKFSVIKAFNPEGVNAPIQAALYMFNVAELLTGKKIQAGIIRANAVYPPKNIHINVHGWPALPFRPINPDDDSTLPNGSFVRFSVPDDIEEWDLLSGAGGLDATVDKQQNFAYDLVPIHHLHDYLEDVDELDHAKFASYEDNNLFLHYVIITYAPWTGFDNDLRINYYSLNLKFRLVVSESFTTSIEKSYTIAPASFNLPDYFRVFNDIVSESPEFPLQAGTRNTFTKEITFRIEGKASPITINNKATDVVSVSATQGNNEVRSFVFLESFDANYYEYVINDEGEQQLFYHPSRAPVFTTPNGFIPGFAIHPRTGEYVFDQNNSAYIPLDLGQTLIVEQTVKVQHPGSTAPDGADTTVILRFSITGVGSNYQTTSVQIPPASVFPYETVAPPPDLQEYAPEAYIEDTTLQSVDNSSSPQNQEFEEVEVFIPFPAATDQGNVFGWQGQEPTLTFPEQIIPTVVLATGQSFAGDTEEYFIEPKDSNGNPLFTDEDFDFELVDPEGPLSSESGIVVKFKPKDSSYHILSENETLFITYSVVGNYNEAPYVGNFENLNDFQRKAIRATSIYNADPEDWRSNIYNPVDLSDQTYLFPETDDAVRRDTFSLPINISMRRKVVSMNYLHEFNLKGYEPTEEFEGINDGDINFTKRLGFDFTDDNGVAYEDVFFYDKASTKEALDDSQIISIINQSLTLPKNKFFDIEKMMPSGFDRDSGDVSKWNMHVDSKHVYGYLIYGYLPV